MFLYLFGCRFGIMFSEYFLGRDYFLVIGLWYLEIFMCSVDGERDGGRRFCFFLGRRFLYFFVLVCLGSGVRFRFVRVDSGGYCRECSRFYLLVFVKFFIRGGVSLWRV